MPQADQLAGPVMRGATGLDPDETRRQLGEEGQHLSPPQSFAQDDGTFSIDCVDLKHALGQVQADCGNFHGGWLLAPGLPDSNPSWHSDAVSGSHPPHLLTTRDRTFQASSSVVPPQIHRSSRSGRDAGAERLTSAFQLGGCFDLGRARTPPV